MDGIDISHWQGGISWPAVAGVVKWAYIKATEHNTWIDPRFRANWANSKSAGLPRGAYMFFRANVSGVAQAQHFIRTLGSDIGELPPAVDVETRDGVTSVQLTNNLRTCLLEVERLTRKPIIYSSATKWNELTTRPSWAVEYEWWLAHYSSLITSPALPVRVTTWLIWQYSSSGRVSGVSGNCDVNRERVSLIDPILTPQQLRISKHAEAIIAEVD